jgi:hypothetical protein
MTLAFLYKRNFTEFKFRLTILELTEFEKNEHFNNVFDKYSVES